MYSPVKQSYYHNIIILYATIHFIVDYCRGFDIANHFCEWCYNYEIDEKPGYTADIDQFPTRDQQVSYRK